MENDTVDDPDDNVCPLIRSDSIREALLEIPTAENIRSRIETIKDVGDQFIEDVNVILEKCGNSQYVIMVLSECTINLAKTLKGEKEKITVDIIKKHSKNEPDYKCIDGLHILHTILLRELPSERIGGIINLMLAKRPSATDEEIEDSLRYLYGSGLYVETPNIPPLPPKNLTVQVENINNADVNAATLENLKSIVDLKPQVIEDISEMFEKFPHDNIVTQMLYSFVNDLGENLNGNTARIDAEECAKECTNAGESDQSLINAIESIFSTRLSEEVYCGIINLMKAFDPNTSIDDIEKALEYLYGPKDDATES